MAPQQLRSRTHEDVEAAHRFEIAVGEGDDRLPKSQCPIADVHARVGSAPHAVRVHALMDHVDPFPDHVWEQIRLKARRRDDTICSRQ